MSRSHVAMIAVLGCLVGAGCGGADEPDPTTGRQLIELHAASMLSVIDLVIAADGAWSARCDGEAGARVAEGRLGPSELAPWRQRVRAFDAPFASRRQLVVRQEPGPTDLPVTTVDGDVEGGKGERLAEDLRAFAARMCRRGNEVPSRFSGPGRPLTVGRAADLGTSEVLQVAGALVITDGRARLCEVLLESMPPQCGGRSLEVAGLDRRRLDLERRGRVAWSVRVTLRGVVRGDVLTIRRG